MEEEWRRLLWYGASTPVSPAGVCRRPLCSALAVVEEHGLCVLVAEYSGRSADIATPNRA